MDARGLATRVGPAEPEPVAAAGRVSCDFSVTADKIAALLKRLIDAVDPVAVIAFGSRARGEHRADSDLDLAVIVDGTDASHAELPDGIRTGLEMDLDLVTISKERFDSFKPWINTLHRQIDREGVRLYERGGQPAHQGALERLCA